MNISRSIPYALITIVVLFLSSGCVRESTDGGTQTFRLEWWAPLLVLVIGLVVTPLGWRSRKESRHGWTMVVLGPIAALFFAPSLYLDRAIVEEDAFSLRAGIWGLTAVHDVEFSELNQVRILSERKSGRRNRNKTSTYLLCAGKDGKDRKIPITNRVSKAAFPHVIKNLEKRGVPIMDSREDRSKP